jgi:hypothetical protein
MFALAILIGIYSYLMLLLGVMHLLYAPVIILSTAVFLILSYLYFRREISSLKNYLFAKQEKRDNAYKLTLSLIFVICFINFVAALGPETAFDSLWYHLTLPKIFLSAHQIFHIPGGLLYYSDMPKLGEMVYLLPLSLKSIVLAKLIHFSLGILCLVALYMLSLKFFYKKKSLISVMIFSGNLVL